MSKETLSVLRQYAWNKYRSDWSKDKAFAFAKSFFQYLTKTHLDSRYVAFNIFLERPKALKERKLMTSRIITKQDIQNSLSHIENARLEGLISHDKAQQYTAFVLFGAYTGQRSMATMSKLTVGQIREALQSTKPVLYVKPSQDKIKMAHWVPLHEQVIKALRPLLDGRQDAMPVFQYTSFLNWVKRQKISLSQISSHLILRDLRKFAEQYGDIIQWDQSNRAYILTHGVSGVEWSHYRHPLPEYVYDVYMQYWRQTKFSTA